jgi:LuxR family maltose regulon positive regulatory protein
MTAINPVAREIYSHKFFAPAARVDMVPREDIIASVFRSDSPAIVLLQGPAGHGKSMTLQQIKAHCDANGYDSCWLTFDEADNDAVRFAMHMEHLLTRIVRDHGNAASPNHLDIRRGNAGSWVLSRLASVDRKVAIFLDEFQCLNRNSILQFWSDVFANSPPNIRFFIGSRSVPELALARLTVAGRILLIPAERLRFSAEETDRYFSLWRDGGLEKDEIETVFDRTEGWPAAIQLFRLGISDGDVRKSISDVSTYSPIHLAEYLSESVLDQQSEDIRLFLTRTSFLTRLTAELCNIVTDRTDSQEVLDRLEAEGLFLRCLDRDRRWFRYHSLFASCMQEKLHDKGEERRKVHAQASQWYFVQHLYEEALHHAFESGDHLFAADVLNHWASELVATEQLATLEYWASRLPLHVIRANPDLANKYAWALTFLRNYQKLRMLFDEIEQESGCNTAGTKNCFEIVRAVAAMCQNQIGLSCQLIENVNVENYLTEPFAAFELAAAANLRAYRSMLKSDFETTRHYLVIADTHNQACAAPFSTGYTAAFGAAAAILDNRLIEALDILTTGLAQQKTHIEGTMALAGLVSCQVWGMYEAGRLGDACAIFEEYRSIIRDFAIPDYLALAYLSVSRALEQEGSHAQSLAVLDEAERIAYNNRWQRITEVCAWERVFRSAAVHDLHQIDNIISYIDRRRVDDSIAGKWPSLCEELEGEAFGRIRVAILRGDYASCEALLATEMKKVRLRSRRHTKLLIFDAILKQKAGQPTLAHRSMLRALNSTSRSGYTRLFVDEGSEATSLIYDIYVNMQQSGDVHDDSSQALLAGAHLILSSAGMTDIAGHSEDANIIVDALTRREVEVLEFASAGMSNRVLSNRLYVSENTIKFHLKNIYGKLNVSGRVEALAKARRMGIIS